MDDGRAVEVLARLRDGVRLLGRAGEAGALAEGLPVDLEEADAVLK